MVGGGPAGLAAAYEAAGQGASVTVFERLDSLAVFPAPSRSKATVSTSGRIASSPRMQRCAQLFNRLLGDEPIGWPGRRASSMTGIYFDYPLTPVNAIFGIGISRGDCCRRKLCRRAHSGHGVASGDRDLRGLGGRSFGRHFFEKFFKSYTEKVWGIPCRRLAPIGRRNASRA